MSSNRSVPSKQNDKKSGEDGHVGKAAIAQAHGRENRYQY